MTRTDTSVRRRFDLLKALTLSAVVAGSTAACVETGSPTDPTDIPQVAGSYSGSITANFPETGTSQTCTASTSVTQNGATVNVAPVVLGGVCGGLQVPVGQAVITSQGNIPATVSGTFSNPACGTYTYTVTGGFDGTTLNLAATLTSPTCQDANLALTLTRQ